MLTVRVMGIERSVKHVGKIIKNLAKEGESFHRELAKFTKNKAQLYVQKADAIATGQLIKGITRRTTKGRSIVTSEAPVSMIIEEGIKPPKGHGWIHRDMVGVEGYTVGDWMDAHGIKGDWINVKRGVLRKPGVGFMRKAFRDATYEASKRAKQIANKVVS